MKSSQLTLKSSLRSCCTALLLWCGPAISAEPETVQWLAPDFPPFFTLASRNMSGVFDSLYQRVAADLPQFDHQLRQAELARIMYEMQKGSRVCLYAMLKTSAREDFAAYSLPVIPLLPPGLVVSKQALNRFSPFIDGAGQIRLERLLEEETVFVGFVRGRSYGEAIDPLLQGYMARHNGDRSFFTRAELLAQMLKVGRIDAMVAHSAEAHYYFADGAMEPVFIPLAEQPEYLPYYFGCTRGDWGDGVLEAVNGVLVKPEVRRSAYLDYRETLLPVTRAAYDVLYQEFVNHMGEEASR